MGDRRPGLVLGLGMALALLSPPAAIAAPYPPPSDGQGTVTPSRIKAGECATFAGDGFTPLATVSVTDNGSARGTTRAGVDGKFSDQLCFDTTAKRGKHVLRGEGPALDTSTRAVSAVLTVQGVSQRKAPARASAADRLPAADGAPRTSNAAFTGAPLLTEVTVGLLLVGGLAWTLVIGELRHRRRHA